MTKRSTRSSKRRSQTPQTPRTPHTPHTPQKPFTYIVNAKARQAALCRAQKSLFDYADSIKAEIKYECIICIFTELKDFRHNVSNSDVNMIIQTFEMKKKFLQANVPFTSDIQIEYEKDGDKKNEHIKKIFKLARQLNIQTRSDIFICIYTDTRRFHTFVSNQRLNEIFEPCKIKERFDTFYTKAEAEANSTLMEENAKLRKEAEDIRDDARKQMESAQKIRDDARKQMESALKEVDILREDRDRQLSKVSVLRTECENQKRIVSGLQDRLRDAESKLLEAESLRKKLHNTILELKGNIRVFCRVRPLLPGDGFGVKSAVSYHTTVKSAGRGIDVSKSGGDKVSFTLDKVFADDASQEQVYTEISELVASALDGSKVCIFAYGQTGSGKTYTMMGEGDKKGLIPRALEHVFSAGHPLVVQASMLEIYLEGIRDLLADGDVRLMNKSDIRHDNDGNVLISGLTIVDVSTIKAVSNLLQKAENNRSVGKTEMNERSSRSHFVLTLKICSVNEGTQQQKHTGILNLIDLAGSERLTTSGAAGERLKETKAINRSLSCLGDVIAALSKKEEHVPFRNSTLTYILEPCLTGDSKTLMFVNISPDPSSVDESLCSLRFAARANSCVIGDSHRQSSKPSVSSQVTNSKKPMTNKDDKRSRLHVGKTSRIGPKAASDDSDDTCSELSDTQSDTCLADDFERFGLGTIVEDDDFLGDDISDGALSMTSETDSSLTLIADMGKATVDHHHHHKIIMPNQPPRPPTPYRGALPLTKGGGVARAASGPSSTKKASYGSSSRVRR